MDASTNIRLFIQRFRGELSRSFAAEGAAFTALAVLGLTTVGMLSAWVVGGETLIVVRIVVASCLAVLLLGSAIAYAAIPWARLRTDEAIARRVNDALPALRGGVLSCVELQQSIKHGAPEFSTALVDALTLDMATQLQDVEPKSLVSWTRTRKLSQSLVLSACVICAAYLLFPAPFAEGASALVYGESAESERPRVVTRLERDVVVGDISYRLVYPAYTQLPTRDVKNSAGDLSVLKGTKVSIQTRSLEPVKKAAIVFEGDAPPIALDVDDKGFLRGELTVLVPGQFHFEVVRPDGVSVVEKALRLVEVEADHKPEIQLIQPAADLEVPNDDPVNLYFSASDDYGLGGVDVVTHQEDENEPPVRRRIAGVGAGKTHIGKATVDLKELDLQPGESVSCWLEVYDNNTVSEAPQRSRSRTVKIKIYSATERHNGLIDSQRQLVEAMLDLLADRLESPIEHQKLSRYDSIVDAQSTISVRSGKMLKAFAELVKALEGDPLSKFDVRAVLEEVLQRVSEFHRREVHHVKSAMGESRVSQRSQHLAVLSRANESAISELEQDITMLDKLIDRQHQAQVVQNARALVDMHREVARLIDEYKKTGDPALKLELQRKLAKLLKRINQLRNELAKNAKPVPYENMNLDAMVPGEDYDKLKSMQSSLSRMQEMLREGDLDSLNKLVESLGREIQSFVSGVEGELERMSGGANGPDQAKLRKLGWDLSKAIHRQDSVNRATDGLSQSTREQLSRMVQEKLAPLIARELERIQRLAKRLARIDRKAMHPDDARRLNGLADQVEHLRETLSQEDIGQALQVARKVHKGLYELEQELKRGAERLAEREPDSYRVTRRRQVARRVGNTVPAARRIAKKLQKLMPQPSDLLEPAQEKKLDRLAERQKRVMEQVQRMRDGVKKLEADFPGVGAQLDRALQEAQGAMGEAQRRLSEHRPSKAEGHERKAMDKLQAARRKLDQALGKEKPGRGGSGAGHKINERVAIPDADRYSVPKEFRDELLRAYKERAPERYRRLIEQYYEALIQ